MPSLFFIYKNDFFLHFFNIFSRFMIFINKDNIMKRFFISKLEHLTQAKVKAVYDIEGYQGEKLKPKNFIYYDVIPTHTYRVETSKGIYFIDNGELVEDIKI